MEALGPADPRRIGEYRLLARLGSGGMGVVYFGRSPGGRLVAVKVIRKRFATDFEYRARFAREVAVARKVAGTFTAPVLDADPKAAAPWLATAYLPGLTLQEAVETFGAFPATSVHTLAAGLAEALVDIHRAGLAHRDLKPANIVLTRDGPRVIDFGIARPDDATAISQVGAVIGTPGFMSPEQAAGRRAGPAGDVFTFGTTVAFAATGREPFGADTFEALNRVEHAQADLSGLTDPWLRGLVDDCLRLDPERRPSAREVLDRLGERTDAAGWLPEAVAAEIDSRAAEARRFSGSAATDVSTRAIDPSRMGAATAMVTPSRPGRRILLLGSAVAGSAIALAGAGAVPLLRRRTESPTTSPSTPSPSRTARPAAAAAPPRAVLRWKVKVSDYYPEVFTAGAVVVAKTDEDQLCALEPRTGRVLWKQPASLFGMVGDDVVYLAQSINPRLTAIDPVSGRTRWARSLPLGEIPVSAVDNGSMLCFGYRRVTALDAGDGGTRWTAKVSPENGLAADARLVAAVAPAKLVGLDARTGRLGWQYRIDEAGDPLISAGLVLLTDRHSTLHAVRARDGKLAWRRPQFGYSSGLGSGGRSLYANLGGGRVAALDAATGDVRWSRQLGSGAGEGGLGRSAIGMSGDALFVGSGDRNLYAVHTTDGQVLWTYRANVATMREAVGIAGLVFVGTREGYVHAVTPPRRGSRAGS